jgi:hypothetical protein
MISAQDLCWTGERKPIAQRECRYSQRFCIAGVCFDLRSNDREVIVELTRRFEEHLSERPAQFTYFVIASDDEYVFQCAHDGSWRWRHGPLSTGAVAFLADAAMMAAVVHFDPQLMSMHAAAFAYNGRAGAIAGDSTAGKTTTLLACARAGVAVYSDERTLVRSGNVHPFLRICSVRSAGRDRLLLDAADDRLARVLSSSSLFTFTQAFGPAVVAPVEPLDALFVLNGYASVPEIERIDTAQALPAISRWFDAAAGSLDRLARAVTLLRSVRCYRLTLGTPAASAQKIMEVMESTE